MFAKGLHRTTIRFVAFVAVISLILSPVQGLATGAVSAAGLNGPLIEGQPVTPLQKQLLDAVNQRAQASLPTPDITFNTPAESTTELFGELSQPLTLEAVDKTTTATTTTTIYFDGPQEAGYEVWPAIEIKGDLFLDDAGAFATGDITAQVLTALDKVSGFENDDTLKNGARKFTITETIEQSPAPGAPLAATNSLDQSPAVENFLANSSLATTSGDILMGFTYTGPNLNYYIEEDEEVCVWLLGCKELYYLRAGFALSWAAGLRLPASATLSESDDTAGTYLTSLTGQDWNEGNYASYGVAPESGNEFVLRLDFFVGVQLRVAGSTICPLPACYVAVGDDYSQSFPTPFGTGSFFPISQIRIPILEIDPIGGIITASVDLVIQPLLTSTQITAEWQATTESGVCSDNGTVTYNEPGQAVAFFPDAECFADNTEPILVSLKNFRYYFNTLWFVFRVGASWEIDIWVGSWSGTESIWLWTLKLTDIISFGSLAPHLGNHWQCGWWFGCYRTGPANTLTLSTNVDKTPPVITYNLDPAPNANGWNSGDVRLTWNVVEDESKFTSSGCEEKMVSAEGVTTFTCTAASAGGPSEASATIKIDKTAPVLTCPVDGPFVLNSGSYSIGPIGVDASISGLDMAAPGVTLIATLTTDSIGVKPVTFRATDLAGNSAEKNCDYSVHYVSSGFLMPVDPSEVNVGKAGRTYPIKWQLTDFNGLVIGSLSSVVANVAPGGACSASEEETELVELASSDSNWRYDSTESQYIYNWKTPSTPGCYKLTLTLDTGQTEAAYFNLK